MHEYHIVERIVKDVVEAAKKNNAVRVTKVNLAVGELSALVESSARLYFDQISKGTCSEGAELVLNPIKTKLKCKSCDILFERKEKEFTCPKCGQPAAPSQLSSELYIVNIEVEKK